MAGALADAGAPAAGEWALDEPRIRQYVPVAMTVFGMLALVYAKTGEEGRALELFAFVDSHPATEQQTRARRRATLPIARDGDKECGPRPA